MPAQGPIYFATGGRAARDRCRDRLRFDGGKASITRCSESHDGQTPCEADRQQPDSLPDHQYVTLRRAKRFLAPFATSQDVAS